MSFYKADSEIWAHMYTVGPGGFVDSDGEYAREVSAQEARIIASQPGQLKDIMWINFDYNPGLLRPIDVLWNRIGESMVATSRRLHTEVVFRPVSEVLESGRITKYTATWLGRLANGNHDEIPDKFEDLLTLAKIR
jgi:hypothetical protein